MARPPDGRYPRTTMTAKEKLRERIETFTEEEAAETLRLLDRRTDPLTVLLDNAPLDDACCPAPAPTATDSPHASARV